MTDIFLPDNIDEMVEEAGKPALAEGKYLGVIMGGEPKLTDKGGGVSSYGVNWKILVNKNPLALIEGWDSEAGTMELTYYTYIGKLAGGKLTDTDKGWAFTKMLKILGVSGVKKLDINPHKFRQIGLVIEHVPGKDDREAMKADPSHVPDQLYVGIKTAFAYMLGAESCPKLAFLADAVEEPSQLEDSEPDAPAGDSEAAEPTATEKPKSKRKPKDGEPETEAW